MQFKRPAARGIFFTEIIKKKKRVKVENTNYNNLTKTEAKFIVQKTKIDKGNKTSGQEFNFTVLKALFPNKQTTKKYPAHYNNQGLKMHMASSHVKKKKDSIVRHYCKAVTRSSNRGYSQNS